MLHGPQVHLLLDDQVLEGVVDGHLQRLLISLGLLQQSCSKGYLLFSTLLGSEGNSWWYSSSTGFGSSLMGLAPFLFRDW